MKALTKTRLVVCGLVAVLAVLSWHLAPAAHAGAQRDQNAGTWIDLYNDANDVASDEVTIGPYLGNEGILLGGTGVVELIAGPPDRDGYWFTTVIQPSSFSAWGAIYLDYTASVLGQVHVEVWDATNPLAAPTLVTGLSTAIGPSDDPGFDGKINLAALSTDVKAIRLRIALDTMASPIPPTVSAIKTTWKPRSVLAATLEAPTTKLAGDAIQLRFPVSVSYVDATSFVAFVTVSSVSFNGYAQPAELVFESATESGQHNNTGGIITVSGVQIPPGAVYWSRASQQAGKTSSYFATFRTPNGLANGATYNFLGNVRAANASPVATVDRATRLTATPSPAVYQNISGAYTIGGIVYADYQQTLTYTVSPTNWWGGGIPNGAQTYFDPVVWVDVSAWITSGIAQASDIVPLGGGTLVTAAAGADVLGYHVPQYGIYWTPADMPAGQRLDYQFTVTPDANEAEHQGQVIETCAHLQTDQVGNPPIPENVCVGAGCSERVVCRQVQIGIFQDADWGFAKGDQINGFTQITTGLDDNRDKFIAFGQTANFRMFVANRGASALNDVVIYDRVPYTQTTFVSAQMPATAGTIYYWQLGDSGWTPDDVGSFTTLFPTGGPYTAPQAGWSTSPPTTGPVTWIAYYIPELGSAYGLAGNPASPTSVVMELNVQTPVAGAVCDATDISNTAWARIHRYTRIGGSPEPVEGHGVTGFADTELIPVRPLVPSLLTYAGGSGSVEAGNPTTATITVQNVSFAGNPLDTARNVETRITIPQVSANGGPLTYLPVTGVSSGGGAVTLNLPSEIIVRWPAILPGGSRSVTLTYLTPTGMFGGSNFTTTAVSKADDDCGPVTSQSSYQTPVAARSELLVVKDLDFRVVGRGEPVTYTLDYFNVGNAPSRKTWVVDRIADGTTLTGATLPQGGQVWFAKDLVHPPTGQIMTALRPDFTIDDTIIRANFTQGGAPVAGWVAPSVTGAKWVAWLVDDASIATPLLPADTAGAVMARVTVDMTTPAGAVINNEASIVSQDFLQAIGNRVDFVVSNQPGLEVAKTCDEVVSVGEPLVYTVLFRNDTTNPDDTVRIRETLPAELVLDADPFDFEPYMPIDAEDPVTLPDGRVVYEWTFPPLPRDSAPGSITISGRIRAGVPSNTLVTNEVIGSVTNAAGTTSTFDSCTTLVQNADVTVSKLVDQPAPRSGETVAYTLAATNLNQRAASTVVVRDQLPENLTYVGQSLRVFTPGWTLASTEPGTGARTLVFRFQRTGLDSGVLPGGASVSFTYQAEVGGVPPGTSLTNTVTITTATGEDDYTNNGAGVTVTTPLPDLYISASATPLVNAGEPVQWSLLYGNDAREDASGTTVFFSLPEATPGDDGAPARDFVPDFSLVSVSPPPGTIVYHSTALLNARPQFLDAWDPGTGWTQGLPADLKTVTHLAFVVTHCGDVGACDDGDLGALLGPFEIQISGVATSPSGAVPALGRVFEVTPSIMMVGVDGGAPPAELAGGLPNSAVASTVTPEADLAVTVTCDPSGLLPGLAPGDRTTFVVEFRNAGTIPAFGVSIDVLLGGALELELDDAGLVTLTDKAGESVAPIGFDQARLEQGVSWVKSGTRYYLGNPDTYVGSTTAIGLAPGDSGRFTIRARVKSDVPNDTPYENVAVGAVEGRDGDNDEVLTSNNRAACGSRVYRSDVFVIKHVANATDPSKPYADGGDRLVFTVEYGNAGLFPASDVIMSDSLDEGLAVITNSFRNIPGGAVFEYDDGSGNWTYVPSGGADPAVRAIRVRYADGATMSAPANAVFSQTTVGEFDDGVYDNTYGDVELQSVVLMPADMTCYQNVDCKSLSGNRAAGEVSSYCKSQGYIDSDTCCQSCCPTAFEVEDCLRTLAERRASWLKCVDELGDPAACGPEPTADECSPPPECADAGRCQDTGWSAPGYCETGYYVPAGQCNASCCPPADRNSEAWSSWYYQCYERYSSAWNSWSTCAYGSGEFNPDCGLQPAYTCDDSPPEGCFDGVARGTYTSPLFPKEDEGNILEWGRVIAHVVAPDQNPTTPPDGGGEVPRAAGIGGVDQNDTNASVFIHVYSTTDGGEELLKTFPAVDGENVYDISDIDPVAYPELYLRAYFTGTGDGNDTNTTCGIRDLNDDYYFFGVPTDLNAQRRVTGYVAGDWWGWDWSANVCVQYDAVGNCIQYSYEYDDTNFTAWVWAEDRGYPQDLHGALPYYGGAWAWSEATDLNDNGTIAGWAFPRERWFETNGLSIYENACIWHPGRSDGSGNEVTQPTAVVWNQYPWGDYYAECLPQLPTQGPPTTRDWISELPIRIAPVFINERGWVATTEYAHDTQSGYETDHGISVGRAGVWCKGNDGTWRGQGRGAGITMGLTDAGVLVANWVDVSNNPDNPHYVLVPVFHTPTGVDEVGCPVWQTADQVQPFHAFAPADWPGHDSQSNVIPLEVNATGTVLTIREDYSNDSLAWIFERWTPTPDGNYTLETLDLSTVGGDGFFDATFEVPRMYYTNTYNHADRFQNYGDALMPNGDVNLQADLQYDGSYYYGPVVWRAGAGELMIEPIQSNIGYEDALSGGSAGGVLGQALSEGSTPWLVGADGTIDLGTMGDYYYQRHVPTHVSDDGTFVVGGFDGQQEAFGAPSFAYSWSNRTFIWSECPPPEPPSREPRLEDWTVTYQTDKNPSFSFEATLDDACRQSIGNTVDVATATPEITLANNTSSVSMTVNNADIAMAIEVDKAVIDPIDGDPTLTYVASLENRGPGTARDAVVTFRFTDGCDPLTTDLWSDDQSVEIIWVEELVAVIALPDVDVGDRLDLEASCEVDETTAGYVLVSSIGVESPTIDCVTANNDPAAISVVGKFPNLYVEVDGPSTAPAGALVPYQITFGNDGNFPGASTIVAALPDGFTFVEDDSATHTVTWDDTTNLVTIVAFGGDGTATNDGVLDIGARETVTLLLQAPGCEGQDTTYDVAATIALVPSLEAPVESTIQDNQDVVATFVSGPTGALTTVVELSQGEALVGHEVVYTIHYANAGAGTIYDAALAVSLPTGLALVSAQPALAAPLGRLVEGTRVLLPGDRGATVVRALVTGPISGPGTLTLAADSGACAVSSDLPVPTATTTPGVSVLVSASQGSQCPPAAGATATPVDWIINVTNTSDVAIADQVVTVVVPPGLTYVPGSLKGVGGNAASAPVLVFTVDIPASGVVSVGFSTRTQASASGLAVVAATVGDIQGQGALAIQCHQRATLMKAWAAGCAVADQDIGVTLTVKNDSSTIVRNAQLVDTLPLGLVVQPGPGYTLAGRTITFAVTELLPGQSKAYTWTGRLAVGDVAFGEPLVNRAVLLSNGLVAAASNQVGGAIADCADTNPCTVASCDVFTACTNTNVPRPEVQEICDGLDNDCDLFVDQADPGLEVVLCDNQNGVCAGSTRPPELCQGADGWATCPTAVYEAHDPIYSATGDFTCDLVDDNCSGGAAPTGGTWESYVPELRACGIGECANTGLTTCVGGEVVDTCVPKAETPEVCDTKDNDCDSLVDAADIDLVLALCDKQFGVCEGSKAPRSYCVGGEWTACDDPVYTGWAFPSYLTSDTACDGLDNDCDSTSDTVRIDEDYQAPATTCGVGACAGNTGSMACENGGTRNTCDPLDGAVAERCNAIDDDCDGENNEDFPTLGQGCDPTPGDGNLCENGIVVCAENELGVECEAQGEVTAERCDNIDNDCNGQTDEGCDDDADDWCDGQMICVTGITIGVCPKGCGDCRDAQGNVNPGAVEACNNIDDDCDGETDEGCDDDGDDWCDAAMACTPVVGVCNKGCGDCNDLAVAVNPGADEVCNNIDDDCDTQTDEGFGTGQECVAGEGECQAPGLTVCNAAGNGVICDALPDDTGVEICNGRDDDCDGGTDEGFGTGVACTVGRGECLRDGTRVCADGQSTKCSVDPGTPVLEVCDGKDNDCDGDTDESPIDPEASVCPDLDTIIDSGPPEVTSLTTASFTFHDPVTPTNLRFECSLDGAAWVVCDGAPGSPGGGTFTTTGLVPGGHTLLVRALGPDGGVDPTPAIHAWVIDTTVPDTFIDIAPQNPSQSLDATFVFSASVPEAEVDTYYCVLDPTTVPPPLAAYAQCDKLEEYTDLAEGPHDMWVYVVNTAGTRDPSPARYRWVIDTTFPDTVILTHPTSPTRQTNATFTYEDPEAPGTTTFQCRIDGGPWSRCDGKTKTWTNLTPGEHVFEVATISPTGSIDPSPAVFVWTIDTTPPDTFIPIHPDNPSQNPTAVFGFASDEDPVTYRCVLDGPRNPPAPGDYAPCDVSETYTDLADGFHRIVVYAIDEAGNVDPTPAVYEWLIDSTFPETQITTGPPTLVGPDAPAVFTYRDPVTPANQHFECSLDDGEWETCDNGTTTYAADELGLGTHELQVRTCVTLPLVQCDPTPAIWVWEVVESTCPLDAQGPSMTCAADPILECVAGGAALDTAAITPTATDACTPVSVATSHEGGFALGQTPVVWVATDGNGNRSTCVTRVEVVDTAAPTIACGDDIDTVTPIDGCLAAVELDLPDAADTCVGEGSLLVYSDAPPLFPLGDTTVTWTAIDPAGNAATCTSVVAVVDDVPLLIECPETLEADAPAEACAWEGTVPAIATDNCALDATKLDQTKAWAVGASEIEFTAVDASGNTGECTTSLVVRDVTAPVPVCGEPLGDVGSVPQVVRALATDACGVEVAISAWTCERIDDEGNATPVTEAECPVGVNGADLSVDGRFADGVLRVTYTVDAVDPSGNAANVECVLEYDPDRDDDGVVNSVDNCVDMWNPDQVDGDDDGVGDACDVCPAVTDAAQVDTDGDGLGDACDNCVDADNVDQGDLDDDGLGNACDVCPEIEDPDQADVDDNGIGDLCQDTDDDGVLDTGDNCVEVPNDDQLDTDFDLMGDACDLEKFDGLEAKGGASCGAAGAGTSGLMLGLALLALVLVRVRARARASSARAS